MDSYMQANMVSSNYWWLRGGIHRGFVCGDFIYGCTAKSLSQPNNAIKKLNQSQDSEEELDNKNKEPDEFLSSFKIK